MDDGVYLDEIGKEVVFINDFEYSREEFDTIVDILSLIHI